MSSIDETRNWIDEHRDEIIEFTKDYIRYRSPTEQEEEVQVDHIFQFFREEMGWDELDLLNIDEENYRPNVNARFKGEGDGTRNLLFNGHSDVVDVLENQQEKWRVDPWEPVVEDGKLYGRGANDMKGPNSAMIWGVKAIMETDVELSGDVLMSIVIGEEFGHVHRGSVGATQDFLKRGIEIPFCINAEPTNNQIHTKSSHSTNFKIRITGRAVHGSQHNLIRYPQRFGLAQGSEVGVDVIPIVNKVVDRLHQLERQWNMRYQDEIWGSGGYPTAEDKQGVGAITLVPTLIDAGDYVASIANTATIEGQFYVPPFVDPHELWDEMEETVLSIAKTEDWLKNHPPEINKGDLLDHLDKYEFWPAFDISVEHAGCQTLGDSIQEVTGESPVYSGFKAVSDAGFIYRECGVDTVSFGPGDTNMGSHGEDEYVPIDQLIEATKVYATMIENWCGNPQD